MSGEIKFLTPSNLIRNSNDSVSIDYIGNTMVERRVSGVLENPVMGVSIAVATCAIVDMDGDIYILPKDKIGEYFTKTMEPLVKLPSGFMLSNWKLNSLSYDSIMGDDNLEKIDRTFFINEYDTPLVKVMKKYCNKHPLNVPRGDATYVKSILNEINKGTISYNAAEKFLNVFNASFKLSIVTGEVID